MANAIIDAAVDLLDPAPLDPANLKFQLTSMYPNASSCVVVVNVDGSVDADFEVRCAFSGTVGVDGSLVSRETVA